MNKKQQAVAFIAELTNTSPEKLRDLILKEAGNDLSAFFIEYVNGLMKNQCFNAQNISSIMLMGYLIRAKEDRNLALAAIGPLARA